MPIFKGPQYTKVTNPKTGNQDPTYIFTVEFTTSDERMSFIATNQSDITLQTLQKTVIDNIQWWNTFIGHFLEITSKLFAKTYTIENISKIAKHTLNGSIPESFPSNIILVPKSIQISGGNFMVNWVYDVESVMIPDFNEIENDTKNTSLPVPKNSRIIDEIEELNIDDIPVGNDSTGGITKVDDTDKFYDKQRVKEARLKAKLAVYKYHHAMDKYYNKYGSDISESETESEYDTSENEEEEEEVQL
jgi:hypothetical protein